MIKDLKSRDTTIQEQKEIISDLEKRPDPTSNSPEWTTTHFIPLAAMAIIIMALLAKDFFGAAVVKI
jgi:hypothetical protein